MNTPQEQKFCDRVDETKKTTKVSLRTNSYLQEKIYHSLYPKIYQLHDISVLQCCCLPAKLYHCDGK